MTPQIKFQREPDFIRLEFPIKKTEERIVVNAIGEPEFHSIFALPTMGRLSGRIFLHRFCNAQGVPYSAIYESDKEVFSCARTNGDEENNMIISYYSTRV